MFHTADPDRSNPTRSRWERPLDTIRSFEAAIDGGYNNRRSIIRPGMHLVNGKQINFFEGCFEIWVLISYGNRRGRVNMGAQ